jgi:Protein of unknown function (DUF3558)
VNRQVAALVAVVAVTAGAAATACSQTVGGNAQRSVAPIDHPGRSFGYVDNRCGMLADSSVQQAVGAQDVARPYSGAVCQYVLHRHSTTIDATFSWYETGTMDRERAVAAARGAEISDTVVERHDTLLAGRSVTGLSCSATTTSSPGEPGVLSWWVQIRGQQTGDPCADAKKLLAATLSSEM